MPTKSLKPLGQPDHLKRRLLWLCCFVFVGGMALVALSGKTCLQAWQARGWRAVACTIDNSGINSKFTPGHAMTHSFFVSYHYTVDGQEYHSETATFETGDDMDLKTVEALSNRYPSRASATCYVDPDQPGNAVLDRTVSPRDVLAASSGAVLVLGSLLAVITVRRKTRK